MNQDDFQGRKLLKKLLFGAVEELKMPKGSFWSPTSVLVQTSAIPDCPAI
jgi:hypothetical protein